MNLAYYNPFSKFFLDGEKDVDTVNDRQLMTNAQGKSEEDNYNSFIDAPDMGAGSEQLIAPINFDDDFRHKKNKVRKYREMSIFPEISEAIDIICDDAIIEDEKGSIVKIQFNKELKKVDERKIREEFDYLVNNVFKKDRIYKLYKKWLIEGEMFLELVINDEKNSIIGVKKLAAYKTQPLYQSGVVISYIQIPDDEESLNKYSYVMEKSPPEAIVFPKEQIAYAYWDMNDYGKNKSDVRGYLEPAVRTYNQLKSLEDAIIVYRLVRAPERRVWNIEVGKMPTGQAKEYVKKLMTQYKKQVHYNSESGMIDSSQNIQALTHDYWFTQREGSGSSIDTIGGGMNLGELEDIQYFLMKLYKVLKMPKDRFQDVSSQYNPGRNMEREEIRFSKFIGRSLNSFKSLFLDALIQQLRFKNFDVSLLDRSLYDVKFTESNFYKQFKKMEIIEAKMNIWSSMSSFVMGPEDPNAAFSAEFVMREWMQMSDDEIEMNDKYKKKEKDAAEQAALDAAKLTGKIEKETADASGANDVPPEQEQEQEPPAEEKPEEKPKPEPEQGDGGNEE